MGARVELFGDGPGPPHTPAGAIQPLRRRARRARPDRIASLSAPKERDLRRTVQQIVDAISLVPLLDDPVPQTVEQLPDVLRFFGRVPTVPEQVIAVPKIYTEDVPMRAVLRATQLVEQLVEVPTTVSFPMIALYQALMAQRTVEQNVDIPAVGGIGTGGGPSGFLPGQSSSVTAEQILESPDPGGGDQDFQPVQGSAASSSDFPGQAGQGIFRTFSQNIKKCDTTSTLEVGTASALEPMDAGAL